MTLVIILAVCHAKHDTRRAHFPSIAAPRVMAVPQCTESGDFMQPSQSAPHKKMVSFVKYSKISQNELRHPKYTKKQPSAREKRTRDVYFERR